MTRKAQMMTLRMLIRLALFSAKVTVLFLLWVTAKMWKMKHR